MPLPSYTSGIRPSTFLHALASNNGAAAPTTYPSTASVTYAGSSIYNAAIPPSAMSSSTFDAVAAKLSLRSQSMLSTLKHAEPRAAAEALLDEARQQRAYLQTSSAASAGHAPLQAAQYRQNQYLYQLRPGPAMASMYSQQQVDYHHDAESMSIHRGAAPAGTSHSELNSSLIASSATASGPSAGSSIGYGIGQGGIDQQQAPRLPAPAADMSSDSLGVAAIAANAAPTNIQGQGRGSRANSIDTAAIDSQMRALVLEGAKPSDKPRRGSAASSVAAYTDGPNGDVSPGVPVSLPADGGHAVRPAEGRSRSRRSSAATAARALSVPPAVAASFKRVVAQREEALRRDYEARLEEQRRSSEALARESAAAFEDHIQLQNQRIEALELNRSDSSAATHAHVAALQSECSQMRDRLVMLQGELTRAVSQRSQAEGMLQESTSGRASAEAAVRGLTQRVDDLIRVMETDRRHASQLQETVTRLSAELASAQAGAAQSHAETEGLKGRCRGLEASEAALRQQLEAASAAAAGDSGRLQRECMRLQSELSEVSAALSTREQELHAANDRIGRLSSKVSSEQEAHLRAREQWEKDKDTIESSLARARDEWQLEREALQASLSKAKEQWARERNEIQASAASAADEVSKRHAMQMDEIVRAHASERRQWEASHDQLAAKLHEAEAHAEHEATKVSRAANDIGSLSSTLQAMQEQVRVSTSRAVAAEDEVKSITAKLMTTEADCKRALAAQQEQAECRLREVTDAAEAHRGNVESKAKQTSSALKQQLAVLEGQVESLSADLERERQASKTLMTQQSADAQVTIDLIRSQADASIGALKAQHAAELQRQHDDLESRITALKQQLQDVASRAQARLDEVNERCKHANAAFDSSSERVTHLEGELRSLKDIVADHRTELAKERSERHADALKFDAEAGRLNAAATEADTRARAIADEASSLRASLATAHADVTRLSGELEGVRRTASDAGDYITSLEKVIDEARQRLQQYEQAMQSLQVARESDVRSLQEGLDEARSVLHDHASTVESQRVMLAAERDAVARLRADLTAASEREAELKSFAAQEQARAARIQSEFDAAQPKWQTALQASVGEVEHRAELIVSLEQHIADLKSSLEAARARADKSDHDLRGAVADAAAARHETISAKSHSDVQQRSLDEARNEITSLQKAHSESLRDARELRSSLTVREGECASLMRQIEALAGDGEEHVRTFDRMREERFRLEEELAVARRDLSEAQAAAQACRLDAEAARAETQNARTRVDSLQREVSSLLDRLERSEVSMKAAQSNRGNAESRAAEAGREASELRRQLAATAAELQETAAALERSKKSEEKAKHELEILRSDISTGRPDVERMRLELDRARLDAYKTGDQLRAVTNDLERSRAECSRHVAQEDKYRQEASSLHVDLERTRGELERLQAQFNRARGDAERSRAELASTFVGDGRSKLEMERLRAQIGESEEVTAGLRDRVRGLNDEVKASHSRIHDLESAVRDAQESARVRSEDFRRSEQQLSQLRIKHDESQADNKALREQIISARSDADRAIAALRDTSRALDESQRALQLEKQTAAEIQRKCEAIVKDCQRARDEAAIRAVEAVAAADAELDAVTARAQDRIAEVAREADGRILEANRNREEAIGELTRLCDEAKAQVSIKESQLTRALEVVAEYSTGLWQIREAVGLAGSSSSGGLGNSSAMASSVSALLHGGSAASVPLTASSLLAATTGGGMDVRRSMRELVDFITVIKRQATAGAGSDTTSFGTSSTAAVSAYRLPHPPPPSRRPSNAAAVDNSKVAGGPQSHALADSSTGVPSAVEVLQSSTSSLRNLSAAITGVAQSSGMKPDAVASSSSSTAASVSLRTSSAAAPFVSSSSSVAVPPRPGAVSAAASDASFASIGGGQLDDAATLASGDHDVADDTVGHHHQRPDVRLVSSSPPRDQLQAEYSSSRRTSIASAASRGAGAGVVGMSDVQQQIARLRALTSNQDQDRADASSHSMSHADGTVVTAQQQGSRRSSMSPSPADPLPSSQPHILRARHPSPPPADIGTGVATPAAVTAAQQPAASADSSNTSAGGRSNSSGGGGGGAIRRGSGLKDHGQAKTGIRDTAASTASAAAAPSPLSSSLLLQQSAIPTVAAVDVTGTGSGGWPSSALNADAHAAGAIPAAPPPGRFFTLMDAATANELLSASKAARDAEFRAVRAEADAAGVRRAAEAALTSMTAATSAVGPGTGISSGTGTGAGAGSAVAGVSSSSSSAPAQMQMADVSVDVLAQALTQAMVNITTGAAAASSSSSASASGTFAIVPVHGAAPTQSYAATSPIRARAASGPGGSIDALRVVGFSPPRHWTIQDLQQPSSSNNISRSSTAQSRPSPPRGPSAAAAATNSTASIAGARTRAVGQGLPYASTAAAPSSYSSPARRQPQQQQQQQQQRTPVSPGAARYVLQRLPALQQPALTLASSPLQPPLPLPSGGGGSRQRPRPLQR